VIDVDAVIQDLLRPRDDEDEPTEWSSRDATRLGPGVVRVEYDVDDSIFVVSVTRVPIRRPAGGGPVAVGTVDDLTVRLTGVTIDTQLIVRLDIADSGHRRSLEAAYHAEFAAWAEQTGEADDAPPRTPGERLFGVGVEVRDDLGTEYSNSTIQGYAGGSGTEWLGGRYFTPVPPPEARVLTIRLMVDADGPVDVDVPLV
jgi:hypothetical protein